MDIRTVLDILALLVAIGSSIWTALKVASHHGAQAAAQKARDEAQEARLGIIEKQTETLKDEVGTSRRRVHEIAGILTAVKAEADINKTQAARDRSEMLEHLKELSIESKRHGETLAEIKGFFTGKNK